MNVIESVWKFGVPEPFEVIHLSDTHLTAADLRDGERKVRLAEQRKKYFPHAEETLAFGCRLAAERNAPILHTGDLIDFVSLANLELARDFTDRNDCFFAAGNHEFSLYVGEAREDAAYRSLSLDAVQAAFKNPIRMSARTIGGVRFVALDNGYYLFDGEQFDFLRAEVERGLPTVLLLHTPLFEPRLYERMRQQSSCAYLVGVPEPLMQGYDADRFAQQRADALTLEVLEYVEAQPTIRAIIAGHLHFNYEGVFGGRIPQIVTSCTDARVIRFE